METIARSGSFYFQWKPVFSVEAICLIRSYSFQSKKLFLIETIPFSGSHYFQWKPVTCSSIHSIQWNEGKPFRESLCFSLKSLPHFFQWKLLLLLETFHFIGSHSFQCFNIFVSRSYHQLRELLNINDRVRLLKMANLSCIHIPVKVF